MSVAEQLPHSAQQSAKRQAQLGRRWGHFKRLHRGHFRCPHPIILDCCFSGSYGVTPPTGGGQFASSTSEIRDGMMLLAASSKDQVALAGTPYSAFTELLIAGLEGSAANHNGHVTPMSLFGFAVPAPAFSPIGQQPVFKPSIQTNTVLRTVRTDVGLGVLRRLKYHFANAKAAIVLDAATDVPGAQRYEDLVALQRAGLLRCADGALPDMVTAGETVRLGPPGWHLWTLASRGRI